MLMQNVSILLLFFRTLRPLPTDALDTRLVPSLEAEVGGRGSLAAGYVHKKAQSRPGFGLLRASVLTSNREEKQLVL